MKLQIDGPHLRLRLSEGQLDTLLQKGRLDADLHCPTGVRATRVLVIEETLSVPACDGDLMDLRIRLPRAAFAAFAVERPRRDGFAFAYKGLDVSVEVDVRDSRRRQAAGAGISGGD